MQVLKLCQRAGLVKLGHVALEEAKVKANASKHKTALEQAKVVEDNNIIAPPCYLLSQKCPTHPKFSKGLCPFRIPFKVEKGLVTIYNAPVHLFGSSGIRGIIDKSLLKLAFEVGVSLGSSYSTAVMGSDTRTSSDAVKCALASGLLAAGCQVYDAGILPTPTLAYAAGKFEAGVMLTASHNPPEYNGIKLWNADGSAFDSEQRREIEEKIRCNEIELASWEEMQTLKSYSGAIEEHIERISGDFSTMPNVKVVVDCGCGAASLVTPYLLKRLGCQVIALNSYPSGFFPRALEPTPESSAELSKVVKATGAALGIAHDGDGDRMMTVDDKGEFIPGDKLMAIFARELGVKSLVTTVDASMVIEELGFKVTRTRVGDAFVSEELKKGGDFGGEPSGSWIFPGVSYCPDGIYAAAQVVQIASRSKLSRLVKGLPSYPILRGDLPVKVNLEDLEGRLMSLDPISVSRVDGIRLSFDDGWLLVRASGTEPKVRITAEAKSEGKAGGLYSAAIRAIREA